MVLEMDDHAEDSGEAEAATEEMRTLEARWGRYFAEAARRGEKIDPTLNYWEGPPSRRPKAKGSLRKGYRYLNGAPEHRTVVERVLGRPLWEFETVHHKNGVRDDNRPENLEVWPVGQRCGQRTEDIVFDFLARYPEAQVREVCRRARERRRSRGHDNEDRPVCGTSRPGLVRTSKRKALKTTHEKSGL